LTKNQVSFNTQALLAKITIVYGVLKKITRLLTREGLYLLTFTRLSFL